MAKAKKAPKSNNVVIKWYGDGKPFGFGHDANGTDVYLGRLVVEEAMAVGVLPNVPQSGDILDVVLDEDHKGVFVAEVLSYTAAPEVCGYIARLTRDGHAILKLDDTQEEALVFERIAKLAALEVGDEVMAVLWRDERGIKAVRVRKTGRTIDPAPSRKPVASQPKAESPKRTVRHSSKKSKADAAPEALLRGVYGVRKSMGNGYGFITVDLDAGIDIAGKDLFVHIKEVERAQNLPDGVMRDGDILQFDIFPGREAGKYEARNLRFVGREEQMKNEAAPKVSAPLRKTPVYEALTGIVDWKEEDGKPNRYGFIVMKEPVPGLKPDVFLHISDVEAAGYTPMRINGAEVTFDIVAGRKPGEYQAANLREVKLPEPAAMGDLFDHLRDAVAAE